MVLPVRAVQLATLVDEAPEGDSWLHEQKFDGYRIVAELDAGHATLWSRRFNDWTAEFPTLARAIERLPAKRAVLDGEVAVVLPDGRTSFQALQNAIGTSASNLFYFAFDLLLLDRDNLTSLPLEQRKARLQPLIAGIPRLRYSDHVIGHGKAFFARACKRGLEGIVSKRRDRAYSPGRNRDWLKTKCLLRQELVVGGFTDPDGIGVGIGALLVGYYQDGALVYAGKVGTGYTTKMLRELRAELEPLEIAKSPFSPVPRRAWTGPNVHWVRPKLVVEVAFSEWTGDGRLRHPSFQGIRRDKTAAEVIRER